MSSKPEELLVTRKFRVVRHVAPGRDGQPHFKDVVIHPGAVTILPMVDHEHVCLIRNERVAVGKTLVELPAGTLEPDEDPAVTAHRELIEETGYRADRMEKLCEFFMSPGILNERMYLYVATGLRLLARLRSNLARRSRPWWFVGTRPCKWPQAARSKTPNRWSACCGMTACVTAKTRYDPWLALLKELLLFCRLLFVA